MTIYELLCKPLMRTFGFAIQHTSLAHRTDIWQVFRLEYGAGTGASWHASLIGELILADDGTITQFKPNDQAVYFNINQVQRALDA